MAAVCEQEFLIYIKQWIIPLSPLSNYALESISKEVLLPLAFHSGCHTTQPVLHFNKSSDSMKANNKIEQWALNV